MKKRTKIIIAVSVLLAVGAFFIFKAKFETKAVMALPTVEAIKGHISSNITALGTVNTAQEQEVYSAIQGQVTYVAEEGQQVRKGELILKIDSEELRLEFEQALSRVKQQKLELSRLMDGSRAEELEKAKVNYQAALAAYEAALDDYLRNQELFDLGAIPEKDLLSIKRELDIKQNQLSIAELELKLLENPDENELALKQAALEEAEKNLENVKQKIDKAAVYAEFDGVVLEQNIKPGMIATPGTLLLRVGNLSDLQVEINVNEYDAALIKLGQKAAISGQGFGHRTYSGEVVKIAPSASVTQTSRGNETVVKAAVKVIDPDGQIKPGFSATVEITVDERQEALLIPLECVIEEEGRKQVVVVKDGNMAKREVEAGIENDLYVEIIKGLSEGEEVLQDPALGGDLTGDAL